jgi:hypothetical protein
MNKSFGSSRFIGFSQESGDLLQQGHTTVCTSLQRINALTRGDKTKSLFGARTHQYHQQNPSKLMVIALGKNLELTRLTCSTKLVSSRQASPCRDDDMQP